MILRVLIGLLAVGVAIGPSASYAKGKKHYHGGYEQKGKVKFFDGRCMVEQKYKKHGGYEEKRKCRYCGLRCVVALKDVEAPASAVIHRGFLTPSDNWPLWVSTNVSSASRPQSGET